VIFAAKNDRVWGKTNFFFFAVSLPTIGGFLEQRGAWVRNGKLAPSKKGREAQYLNQPPLAPQDRGFNSAWSLRQISTDGHQSFSRPC
jgi:hypothetical protein